MKLSFYLGLILLALGSSSSAFGQLLLGPRGGIDNGSHRLTTHVPSVEAVTWQTGWTGGVELDRLLTSNLSVGLQLLLDQKGALAIVAVTPDDRAGSVTWACSYLELPLLGKWSFGASHLRPYIFAGPSLGLLLKAKQETYSVDLKDHSFTPRVSSADLTDSLPRFAISALGGAGLSYSFSGGPQCFVELGYSLGLTRFYDYSTDLDVGSYAHSRNLYLLAGLLFPL